MTVDSRASDREGWGRMGRPGSLRLSRGTLTGLRWTRLVYSPLVKDPIPPVGQPLQLLHPVLPPRSRLWGAGRPSYPDEPPQAAAVEAGVRAWKEAGVSYVLSLIEDWEVPRRAPGLFETLTRKGIDLQRYPIVDFGVPREAPGFLRVLGDIERRLAA